MHLIDSHISSFKVQEHTAESDNLDEIPVDPGTGANCRNSTLFRMRLAVLPFVSFVERGNGLGDGENGSRGCVVVALLGNCGMERSGGVMALSMTRVAAGFEGVK